MSLIDSEIIIKNDNVTYKYEIAGQVKNDTKDLNAFFSTLSSSAFFDSGLLPLDGSGTLMIRQAMGHTQVAFQHAPGIYRVIWGEHEGSVEAVHYDLAMPYRIVIGDFVDNEFYGARHFYSTTPITSENQLLYNVNLPNLNCKGYGHGNGVGWICLYHNHPSVKDLPLGKKISHLIERAGGTEAYNDANMSGTDGPRYYAERYQIALAENYEEFEFLWNPQIWEEKTLSEGYEWTLNPEIWLPVNVAGLDSQEKNLNTNDSIPYTFGMAVNGQYRAYYNDPNMPKNYQKFIREDIELPKSTDIYDLLRSTFTKTPASVEVKEVSYEYVAVNNVKVELTCAFCDELFVLENKENIFEDPTYVCELCVVKHYEVCASCDTTVHYSKLTYFNDNFHCTNCLTLHTCLHCGAHQDDESNIIGQWCVDCANPISCNMCYQTITEHNSHKIISKDPSNPISSLSFDVCENCFPSLVLCGCGYVRSEESVAFLKAPNENGNSYTIASCGQCISYKANDEPYFNPVEVNIPSVSNLQ